MRRHTLAEQIKSFEVLPAQELSEGKPIVARLIGRRFDELTDGQFAKPYDPRFGKTMLKTLSHLCATLGASFGFAERTELSLYAVSHGGEARRLLSRICGEAAAKLSLLLGRIATFEARLYEFDSVDAAYEYFEWRREEAHAASLDAWAIHLLGTSGTNPAAIPQILDGLDDDEKEEILRQNNVDFGALPPWQRLGAAVYVRSEEDANAARLVVDLQLPDDAAWGDYLRRLVV